MASVRLKKSKIPLGEDKRLKNISKIPVPVKAKPKIFSKIPVPVKAKPKILISTEAKLKSTSAAVKKNPSLNPLDRRKKPVLIPKENRFQPSTKVFLLRKDHNKNKTSKTSAENKWTENSNPVSQVLKNRNKVTTEKAPERPKPINDPFLSFKKKMPEINFSEDDPFKSSAKEKKVKNFNHPSQQNIEFVADERMKNRILNNRELTPGILKSSSNVKTSVVGSSIKNLQVGSWVIPMADNEGVWKHYGVYTEDLLVKNKLAKFQQDKEVASDTPRRETYTLERPTGDVINKLAKFQQDKEVASDTPRRETYTLERPTGDVIIDETLPLSSAATLWVNPATAYRMLKDFEDLKEGSTVIQNGANGAVGQAVIQIAKCFKINTVNVIRDRPNVESLKSYLTDLGATHVVVENELWSPIMADIFKNIPKPLLGLNCVGGKSAAELIRHMADGGTLVSYGAMSKQPLMLNTGSLIFNDIRLRGFWMTKWKDVHSKEESEKMLSEITSIVKKGLLKPPTHRFVKFDNFKEAVAKAMDPFVTEKQILSM